MDRGADRGREVLLVNETCVAVNQLRGGRVEGIDNFVDLGVLREDLGEDVELRHLAEAEGGRRESPGVGQVDTDRVDGPGVVDHHRIADLGRSHHHLARSCDHRRCPHRHAVLTGEGEAEQLAAIFDRQRGPARVERNRRPAVAELAGRGDRAAPGGTRLAVGLAQGYTAKAVAHVLLVLGMDVLLLADIDGDGDPGVRDFHRRLRERLTDLRPAAVLNRTGPGSTEVGELHEVHREIVSPQPPPGGDQPLQLHPVVRPPPRVAFPLVPDRTAYRERHQGVDHGVEQVRRVVLVLAGLAGLPRPAWCLALLPAGIPLGPCLPVLLVPFRSRGWVVLRVPLVPARLGALHNLVVLLPLPRSPRLDACAAPGGIDQADGNVQVPVQLAPEEVPRRAERPHCVGRTRRPRTDLALVPGLLSRHQTDGQQPDARVVRGGDLFGRVCRAPDSHPHVRLPGAEPDLAREHVIDLDAVGRPNGDGKRPSSLRSTKVGPPPAVHVSGRRGRGPPRTGHDDLLTGIRPSPEGRLPLALEDHVVAEQRR